MRFRARKFFELKLESLQLFHKSLSSAKEKRRMEIMQEIKYEKKIYNIKGCEGQSIKSKFRSNVKEF